MINLLPPEHKKEIKAGRANVVLARYLAMLGAAIVLLTGLVAGSYIVLNTTKDTATNKVADNESRFKQYQEIKDRGDQFRSDLATAKSILDNEVTYSKLIYKIADAVPSNVVLDSLALDKATLGSKATMEASAESYADGVRLKTAFIEDPEVFSDVSFETLTYPDSADEKYPVKVSLSVTINKEAL